MLNALEKAIHQRRPTHRGFVHPSGRGSQYLFMRYIERLAAVGTEPLLGSVGDSYDNALAKTVALFRSCRVFYIGVGRLV